jgi:hypothetical protein
MEEAAFMRELDKYKKVRRPDWTSATVGGAKRRPAAAAAAAGGSSKPAPASLSATAKAAAAAATAPAPARAAAAPAAAPPPAALAAGVGEPPALPEATLRYGDFWEGLDALLAVHFPDARTRKAVAAAFDEVHYDALRSGLNLEDVDDVAAMMARELAEEGR